MPPTRLLALSIGVALLVASSVHAAEVPDPYYGNYAGFERVEAIVAGAAAEQGYGECCGQKGSFLGHRTHLKSP